VIRSGEPPSAGSLHRVRELVRAARRIADPSDALGKEARATLPAATGLSPEGVALALEHHLETEPSDAELEALVRSVTPARRAWIVPSAGIFVGAHRAIALGLAASDQVFVKPSRREPEMVRLLAAAAPGLFAITPSLGPLQGDAVFAYGTDETLRAIGAAVPAGVQYYPHGPGIGVAFVELAADGVGLEDAASRLTEDVVPFDQRGCLSPRIAVVAGAVRHTRVFVQALASFLAEAERHVPIGRLSTEEAGARARYRDTLRFAGELFSAGSSWVGLDVRGEHLVVPPPGRNVHVVSVGDVPAVISQIAPLVTAVGIDGREPFASRISPLVPRARVSRLGYMQRPLFDGPVDRRGL
jgi:hypothetical protein